MVRNRRDPLDVDLVDVELQEEVELLMQLMAAASTVPGHLETTDIDAVLFARE